MASDIVAAYVILDEVHAPAGKRLRVQGLVPAAGRKPAAGLVAASCVQPKLLADAVHVVNHVLEAAREL